MMRALLLALVMIAPCAWSDAHAPATDHAAQALIQRLGAIRSFTGTFEQLVVDERGMVLDESNGEVAFQRPGQLRWRTLAPFEQLLVSDGQWVWFYDPDLEQATRRKLGRDVTEVPGLLLTGDPAPLAERFDVFLLSEPEEPDESSESVDAFVLMPHERDSAFVRLSLEFAGPDLVGMQLNDAVGNITRIRLSGVASTEALPAALFAFDPPKGVDVVIEDE